MKKDNLIVLETVHIKYTADPETRVMCDPEKSFRICFVTSDRFFMCPITGGSFARSSVF